MAYCGTHNGEIGNRGLIRLKEMYVTGYNGQMAYYLPINCLILAYYTMADCTHNGLTRHLHTIAL
jgi:hypothetical protein